jgi:acetyl esterase
VSAREERFERFAARVVGSLPEPVRRRIVGGALPRREGVDVDSRIAALTAMATRRGRTFDPSVTVEQLRRSYARLNRICGIRESRPVVTRELNVPTGDGPISARLYRPSGAATEAALPLLVFFHGGGFVIGDVPSYDGLARFFAVEGNMAIVSVEYRLAPEYPYPRGYEDGVAAYAWVVQNAAELGADAARVAVGGDSAGGSIATMISSVASSRALPRPAYQFLIYPGLDYAGTFPSRSMSGDGLPFTPATISWFARYNPVTEDRSPFVSPLVAPNPEQQPPTYLLAAGFDPLVDEGKAFAERLRGAGVDVSYDLRPNLTHAFVNLAGVVPAARDALRDGIRATAAALRAAA